jgi:hypothetical protein
MKSRRQLSAWQSFGGEAGVEAERAAPEVAEAEFCELVLNVEKMLPVFPAELP